MSLFGGGGAVERIGVELVAKTGKFLSDVDGAVNKGTSKFGGLAKNVGKAMVVAGAAGGVAIAGLGAAAVKMGMDFEASIAEVKTLLPDLADEGFNKLKGDVLDLSKEMGIATSDMVPALYQAISAGVPPENVIDFLRTGAKASIGGVTDLATAVDGLSTVVNAFGLDASETGHVADVMFTAVKLGKTTMAELSQSMFQAAPLAASLGLKIEDVAGATATLTKSGTPTSVAMTQIRQAMVALSKPTADMAPLIEATGYESGEALLQAEGFAGALQLLTDAAGGNKEVLAKAFGSVEALQAVLGLTGENAEVAAADLAAMNDATGAADAAFETMSSTLKFKINKAINAAKIEMTKFGIKVLPLVEKGIRKIGEAGEFLKAKLGPPLEYVSTVVKGFLAGFERFNDPDVTSKGPFGFGEKLFVLFRTKLYPVLEELPPILKAIMKEALAFAAVAMDMGRSIGRLLLPALDTLADLWRGAIAPALKLVMPLLAKVGQFLLDHKPIIVGVAAAILLLTNPWLAVVAAIVLVLAKWDEISAFFIGIGETIKKFVDDVIQKVSDFPIIGEIIKDAVRMAVIYVETQLEIMKALFKAALDTIINTFNFWKAVFTGDWDAAWQAVKDQFGVIMTLLSSLFGIALDAIKAVLQSKLEMVKGIGSDLGNLIVDAAKAIWDEMKARFNEALTSLTTWVNDNIASISAIGTTIGNAIVTAIMAVLNFPSVLWDFVSGAWGWLGRFGNNIKQIGTYIGQWIWSGIKSAMGSLADLIPGLGSIPGLSWLTGKVTGKQHGGPLAAGEWARVNESGIEFFRPYSSGTVIPIAPAGGGAAAGGAWTNYGRVTYVYGPGRRTDDVLRDLDRMVK